MSVFVVFLHIDFVISICTFRKAPSGRLLGGDAPTTSVAHPNPNPIGSEPFSPDPNPNFHLGLGFGSGSGYF